MSGAKARKKMKKQENGEESRALYKSIMKSSFDKFRNDLQK